MILSQSRSEAEVGVYVGMGQGDYALLLREVNPLTSTGRFASAAQRGQPKGRKTECE